MATQQSSQEGTSQPNDLGLSSIFDYEELQEATKFFNPSEVIGEGGFGVVYRGMLKDGRAVAVKELTVRHKQRMEQFFNEARVLSRLHHKNLVTLYGCTDPLDEKMLLVYEFVPNGTLADHLQRRRFSKEVLTWRQRLQIAIETAEALTYLHSLEPPIIHRDVKTENILLDNNFSVKVADFGMCRHLPPSRAHISTMPQGTQGYLDPEYNQLYKLTVKSDVYSFGVVMMELISGKAAVDLERDGDEIWLVRMAFNKMKNDHLDQFVDLRLGYQDDSEVFHMINSVAQLAYECLQSTGYRRPPMIDVLKSLKTIQDRWTAVRDWCNWPQSHEYNPAQRTVCVTGAGGFIGSWLVKLLLQRGYTVKGTVRNPDDAENNHLRALDGAAERLNLCKADMLDYDALRSAMDGCVGVFHTIFHDPDQMLERTPGSVETRVRPPSNVVSLCKAICLPVLNRKKKKNKMLERTMVKGTKYVIDAAADAGVRRVVYTSYISARAMDLDRGPDFLIDESCRFRRDLDVYQMMEGSMQYWYTLAAEVAEQAAWENAGNRGVHLLVVCPAHVIGPLLQPGINYYNAHILRYMFGTFDNYVNVFALTPTFDNYVEAYVHVRDVAEAHVRVFEAPEAKGRYLCAESVLHQADVVRILAKLFPGYPLPSRFLDEFNPQKSPVKFSTQKLRDLGLEFAPATQCLYDTVKSLQEKGHLPIINST